MLFTFKYYLTTILLFLQASLRDGMVDMTDSKSVGASRGGSSPPAGTTFFKKPTNFTNKVLKYLKPF